MSAKNGECKVDLKWWVFFWKAISRGTFYKSKKSVGLSLVLHTGVLRLIFLTVHERGGRVLRDVHLRMQIRWLDCVYITLRSDHNASSTASGPGHADRITSARLHLSFQCVCGGQHPDRGCKLMPSVNAAFSFILVRFRFKTSKILLFFFSLNWIHRHCNTVQNIKKAFAI